MSFTTKIKDEITKVAANYLELQSELAAIVRYNSKIEKNKITITSENASVARRIYKSIKEIFKINPQIIIRRQKRFKVEIIYILEMKERLKFISDSLYLKENFSNLLETQEEKIAFFKGCFLAAGSISDPALSGYHFELVFKYAKEANNILKLLKQLDLNPKKIKRNNKYMIYLKSAEDISDVLKMFRATNNLFYFEDIRIYRDHKNMVNRLNNCEIANQEKTISTGLKQLDLIKYLKDNHLTNLLDEKTLLIADYREKYPEVSFQELAEIISLETDYKIGKSGINHQFIKIKELIEKHKKS